MDKSRICYSRTINLAKQPNIAQTKLLVYEKGKEETQGPNLRLGCYDMSRVPKASPTKCTSAKRIRVCTGAEMRKICRPAPCPCPPNQECITLLQTVMRGLGFSLKTLFTASLLYWTWEAGIWGDSGDTEQFYTQVCHLLQKPKPERELSEDCEAEMDLIQIPPAIEDTCSRPPINREKIIQTMKEKWNGCVTCIFEGVAKFPHNIIAWYKKKTDPEVCTVVRSK